MQIKLFKISFIFLLFLFSCKKETEKVFVNVEVEKQKAWEKHIDINYGQKYNLAAFIDESKNQYVCYGGKYFNVIDASHKLKTTFSFFNVQNYDKKIISNKDFQIIVPRFEYNLEQDILEIYPKLKFEVINRPLSKINIII